MHIYECIYIHEVEIVVGERERGREGEKEGETGQKEGGREGREERERESLKQKWHKHTWLL